MTYWRRSLFGYLADSLMASDQFASGARAREDYFADSMYRQYSNQGYPNQGYPGQGMGYPNQGYPNQGYPNQGGPYPQDAPPDINTAYAISSSLAYANEINDRRGSVYPKEAMVRLSERLQGDYLTFLGYLHDPDSADPIRQVAMVNELLGINITPKRFFQLRNENSLGPDILRKIPTSLIYFVRDDLSGRVRPKDSSMSMSRFLVNTFRDLGLEYIAFGGVSEVEIQRLTDYITMMNDYLKKHGLYYTQDPYRRGGKGDPTFGIPGMKSEMPDTSVDLTHAASYFEDDPPRPEAPWCIDASPYPDAEDVRPGGIDFPEGKGSAAGSVRSSGGSGVRNTAARNAKDPAAERDSFRGELGVRGRGAAEAYPQPEEYEADRELDGLMDQLDHLIGLSGVKKNLNNLINVIRIRKIREDMGLAQPAMSMHLVFSGNPGTGKTTVARLLARIYKALGVVSQGQLVEVDRAGLVEGYVGQTAQKTNEVIDSAMGGVLFIDEAYTLTNQKENGDYGQEAVDTLLKRMEDDRDSFVVIVAGYSEPMEEFLESNPGLRSRFSKFIEFEDYSDEELNEIFTTMCTDQDYHLTDQAKTYLKEHFHNMVKQKAEHFANGREVRNFFERCIERQANRLAKEEKIDRAEIMTFTMDDVTESWVRSKN